MAETKGAEAFRKIEALRKEHPGLQTAGLAKKAKVSLSNYYWGRKQAGAAVPRPAKAPKKRKYERVAAAPSPTTSGKIPVILCTPEQIRELLS